MINRSLKRVLIRFNSHACTSKSKTVPIEQCSQVLRHLQFTKPMMPFENGLEIQENIVRMQLDFKKLESKIIKQQSELDKHNMEFDDKEKPVIEKIMELKPAPAILTFQFQPTFTGGKRIKKQMTPEQVAKYEHFKPAGVNESSKFVQLERGGEITFHGPGQLVAYILIDLKTFSRFPPKCFVNGIEEAAIDCLADFGVEAKRTNNTGVWSAKNQGKLASIGVNVRRNITSHGICINVSPNLGYLNHFTMCGLPDAKATSMEEVLTQSAKGDDLFIKVPSIDEVATSFTSHISRVLGITKVETIKIDTHTLEDS